MYCARALWLFCPQLYFFQLTDELCEAQVRHHSRFTEYFFLSLDPICYSCDHFPASYESGLNLFHLMRKKFPWFFWLFLGEWNFFKISHFCYSWNIWFIVCLNATFIILPVNKMISICQIFFIWFHIPVFDLLYTISDNEDIKKGTVVAPLKIVPDLESLVKFFSKIGHTTFHIIIVSIFLLYTLFNSLNLSLIEAPVYLFWSLFEANFVSRHSWLKRSGLSSCNNYMKSFLRFHIFGMLSC